MSLQKICLVLSLMICCLIHLTTSQDTNCRMAFQRFNMDLATENIRFPIPKQQINKIEDCQQLCTNLQVCSGITWVPSCPVNGENNNCFFSTDTSAGGRPAVKSVTTSNQAGCEWQTFFKDCSQNINDNNNGNNNNDGNNGNVNNNENANNNARPTNNNNANTDGNNNPILRQVDNNNGWLAWKLWSPCCKVDRFSETQTRSRECSSGQTCPCSLGSNCSVADGVFQEFQTRQCSECTQESTNVYWDYCRETHVERMADQCDCKFFYRCVNSDIATERRPLKLPCPSGTRFDTKTNTCSVLLIEGDSGFQRRQAPAPAPAIVCAFQKEELINRYRRVSNGTLYECPPGFVWEQNRCMCLPGLGLVNLKRNVVAKLLCDGTPYNANGNGEVYIGPFNSEKTIHYTTHTAAAGSSGNKVCVFSGNSNQTFTPGLQIPKLKGKGEVLNPSVAFWFMTNRNNGVKQTILSNRRPVSLTAGVTPTMEFYLNSNNQLVMESANLATTMTIPNIQTNQWNCVVAVFDNRATKLYAANTLLVSLYMKRSGEALPTRYGIQEAKDYIVRFPGTDMNIGMAIGKDPSTRLDIESDMFFGEIDSVTFYENQILSFDEITSFCATSPDAF